MTNYFILAKILDVIKFLNSSDCIKLMTSNNVYIHNTKVKSLYYGYP